MGIIKGHTYHTFRILHTIGGMPRITEWAAFHHEWLDGNGYPFRHEGKDLTLGARIMAVADVFTAITEDRPYRKGMAREDVLSVLNEQAQGTVLDGDVKASHLRPFAVDLVLAHERPQLIAAEVGDP